jgi:hypothetical protein
MSLTLAISEALREIRSELFRGPAPHLLHHYTRAAAVESVVQGRALWATCIADQSDQTEISHTSGIVTKFSENFPSSDATAFSSDVLRRLPFFMDERKQWVFIACFCDDHDSALHWREYGDYRITFPAPWTIAPSLALRDSQAECWYQQILYDERLQRHAIERALRAIVVAISENTNGRNEGPWAKAMVDSCARNAAQLLLSLAVGFKRSSFSGEREWRIVCAPRLGSNNSAPTWIDENFSVNIKRSPRSHVLLQVQRDQGHFQPLLIPPVPFSNWSWKPNRYHAQEVARINDVLAANHRADLSRSLKFPALPAMCPSGALVEAASAERVFFLANQVLSRCPKV